MGALADCARNALHQHQRAAVDNIEAFLDRDECGGRSYIVSMPTGSGKSGVISYVAQDRLGAAGDVLLLCPWDALATQLSDDVGERFWRHAGVASAGMSKPIRLKPSNARERLTNAGGPTIWVMTLAALAGMDRADRAALASRLQNIMVDEGHYEPAPSWANSIRGLGRPTIVFTATPFRNDIKYFKVAEGDSHHFPTQLALDKGLLRSPRFATASTKSVDTFVDELIAFDRTNLVDNDKVIVRCATASEIRDVVARLRSDGQDAVGIHETFRAADNADGLLTSVPVSHQARYWVHQNKLLEGIDREEFRCVALYQAPSSERALVQQIGRVLRGVKRHPDAWVLGAHGETLEKIWKAFLAYDFQNDASKIDTPAMLSLAFGGHYYTGGTFRSPVDFGDIDADELRLLRSFSVHQIPPGSKQPLVQVLAHLDQAVLEADGTQVGTRLSGEWQRKDQPAITWAAQLLYIREQSPIFARSGFYDARLALAFFAVVDSRLYAQPVMRLEVLKQQYSAIPPEMLRSAFSTSTGVFTTVTLKNTDLSSSVERTRVQSAASLAALAPDLGDYYKSPRTITGVVSRVGSNGSQEETLRYVGFANARVKEHGRVSIRECLHWLSEIEAAFATSKATLSSPIFARYAEIVSCADPVVKNFLLDLDPEKLAKYRDSNGRSAYFKDICVAVGSKSDFNLVRASDGHAFKCSLGWSGSRYTFHSNDLDSQYTSADSEFSTFSAEITGRQAFRLIVHPKLAPGDLVQYIGAQFVKPRNTLALTPSSGGVALDSLIHATDLQDVKTEKGQAVKDSTWTHDSMFWKICSDIKKGKFFDEPVSKGSVVVCDDDSGETADFYIVDISNKKLIMVHAKVGKGAPGRGASGLYDVIAQAQKHLGTIRPGGVGFDRTRMRERWRKKWTLLPGSEVPKIQSNHTVTDATKAVWEALRDPAYDRQIVIATAKILSKKKFTASARAKTPQAMQGLYLIQSAWSAAGSVGARLRIVTDP